MSIYDTLQQALADLIAEKHIEDEAVEVSCAALSVSEAIGNPEEQDYPIQKGREVMVEAAFRGFHGQAFSCEGGNTSYTLAELCSLALDSDRKRADFIASLNAVFACFGLCNRTVHCHNQEPVECAKELQKFVPHNVNLALFGLQPRFLQALTLLGPVRAVDLDPENIGQIKSGITIEGPDKTDEVLDWCDFALITGSAIVNDSIKRFIDMDKPYLLFGTTIAASAVILDLPRFCICGHDSRDDLK